MWRVAVAIACVVGCGESKKSEPPPPEPKTEAPEPALDAAKPESKAKPKAKPNKKDFAISPQTRAIYKQHLRAGRAFAKQNKWKEASAEFELALKAIPGDGRALGELGWSAFKADDYKRAREANLVSARVTGDPQIEAASLYNLGRVAEATGDKAAAADAYRRSLELRPNKTVESRLAALGAVQAKGAGDCEPPLAVKDVCRCLSATAPMWDDEDDGEIDCTFEPDASARYETVLLDSVTVTHTSMVAKRNGGWVEFDEGGDTFSGMGGVNESYHASIEPRKVAGREVLWVLGTFERSDADAGINEWEQSTEETLTVCVVPESEAGDIVCPLEVQLSYTSSRELIEEEDGYDPAGELQGEPISFSSEMSATLTEKGTVVIKHVRGELDPEQKKLIGEHKLF